MNSQSRHTGNESELKQLRESIQLLSERLDRLERRVGIDGGGQRFGDRPVSSPQQHPSITSASVAPMSDSPVSAAESRIAATSEPVALPVEPIPYSAPASTTAVPVEVLPGDEDSFGAAAPQHRNLELTIGLNWSGWIGAVVVVLGVCFFIKYAWDQGWINPTPTMRIIAAIVTGVMLGAIGEWMHRRRVRILAATLHGAGLAIVLASFFGAYALWPQNPVLGVGAAFVGVAITAAVGVILSLHINSMVLAIIALVGAYLAPFVLDSGQDRSAELLAYLGVLSAVGWVLSCFKPRWIPLRKLAWTGTIVSFAAWWSGPGRRNDHQSLATTWLTIYWLGFFVEMILSLRRQRGQVVERMLDPACAILSLLNTAAMFGLLCVIYPRPEHRPMLGVVSLGLAGAHAAAVVLVRARGFAASSLLQSAALVTLAFPLLLDQFAITLAWLALAGVLAALAWQLNLPAARGWAIVLLLLSVWRLVSFDSGLRSEVVWSIGSFTVSRWMLMAWASAILAHGIAWLSPGGTGLLPGLQSRIAELLPTPKRFAGAGGALEGGGAGVLDYATAATDESHLLRRLDPVGVFVSACGTLCYVAAVASAYQGSALTLLLIVWTAAIVALGGVDRRLGYLPHASVLAGLVSINWLLVDALAPIVEHWSYPRAKGLPLPLINSVAGNGALLSATIWGLWMQWRRSRVATVSETHTLIVWAAILLLVMLNVEACRFVDWLVVSGSAAISDVANVKQVVMSVLWATTGFVAVLIGFRRNIAALRYAALALLGLTLLKILLIDMAEVKAVWRILSFVVVGGLLLAVSYLYHRQSEGRAPTN